MTKMKLILAAIALLAASAAPALAFRATNGLVVDQTGERQFHVAFGPTLHKTDFLCAAADYASRGLGLPGATRLYRQSPAPRKSGEGITFTLDPARKVPMGLFIWLWVDNDDGGISVENARSSYCYNRRSEWR